MNIRRRILRPVKQCDRLVKQGMEPANPGLQGKQIIHYTAAAPRYSIVHNRGVK